MDYISESTRQLQTEQGTKRLIAELVYAGLEILDPDEVAPYPGIDWNDQTNTGINLDILDYDTGIMHQFLIEFVVTKTGEYLDREPDDDPFDLADTVFARELLNNVRDGNE